MTKKLTVLFMMAVLTVALAAAGCGKKAEESAAPAGGTEASAAAPAPADSAAAPAAGTERAPDTTKH